MEMNKSILKKETKELEVNQRKQRRKDKREKEVRYGRRMYTGIKVRRAEAQI